MLKYLSIYFSLFLSVYVCVRTYVCVCMRSKLNLFISTILFFIYQWINFSAPIYLSILFFLFCFFTSTHQSVHFYVPSYFYLSPSVCFSIYFRFVCLSIYLRFCLRLFVPISPYSSLSPSPSSSHTHTQSK